MLNPLHGCCSVQLSFAFISLLLYLNQMTQGMPAPPATYVPPRTARRGGVEAIYVNIQNLNLNMSVGSFVLPTWSYYLGKAFSFAPSPPDSPAAAPTRTPDSVAEQESAGAWTVIDLDTTASNWYPMMEYQFLDLGNIRSEASSSPPPRQVPESGLEQYGLNTRETGGPTTTLNDNVTEVVDKNLATTASSDNKNNDQTGERQEAPGGSPTSLQHPVLFALPLEFPLQETSRSVLGPGVSVGVTAAGIGLALYSLARTYRYLVPLWQHPFPFYHNMNSTSNSTLSKTWVNVIDSVNGLNLNDMFTSAYFNSTNFKTD